MTSDSGAGLPSAPRIDTAIGRTPMVRLSRIVEPDMADVWVKVEGMNPGGSIKDRTALGMIADAEARGLLAPGGTIVEPTSGNTGIGLAQVASARGYHLVLCLPAQMSEERKRTLRAYGAELVLTDPERRMLAAIEEGEDHGIKMYRDDLSKLDGDTRMFVETQLLSAQERTHRSISSLKKTLH